MIKTISVIILTILFGCVKDKILNISNFPTIIIQAGIKKTIDLTRYISDFDNISIGKTDGVTAEYLADSKLLNFTVDDSKSLIKLYLKIFFSYIILP